MRCTNKKLFRKRRNRKRELAIRLGCGIGAIIAISLAIIFIPRSQKKVEPYDYTAYTTTIYQAELFADNLCVSSADVDYEAFKRHDKFPGALLFDIENQQVLYSENANSKLYPARF